MVVVGFNSQSVQVACTHQVCTVWACTLKVGKTAAEKAEEEGCSSLCVTSSDINSIEGTVPI